MKQLKFRLLLLVALVAIMGVQAQNEKYPWLIGAGVNIVDYYPYNPKTEFTSGEEFDERLDHFNYGAPSINISRYIADGFSFGIAGSMATIDNYDGYLISDDMSYNPTEEELDYLSVDGVIKYNLNDLIGKTGIFDPYLTAGGGYILVGDHGTGTANAGLGTNIWLTKKFGLSLDSKYKHTFETFRYEINQHFQHTAGLVYRFGKSSEDTDRDGVTNDKDDCPKTFGLKSLNGCPDSDGDMVADINDACPNRIGLAELNGCPDRDKDGVADKDDNCPDMKGTKRNQGCPDTDGDGIIDSKDKCPAIAGPEKNNGCPLNDADNDGVVDEKDECVNEPGPASNKGCPKMISEEEVVKLEQLFKTVYFDSGKAIFRGETISTLDEAFLLLRKYIYKDFSVEGHTDNRGNDKMNLELSRKRADAVKNYFVNRGVEEYNINAVGYGETKPIASNKSKSGMAKNRRVEIKVTLEKLK